MNILGTLFTSSVFPSHSPEGHVLLTTFIGGARQSDLVTSPLDHQNLLVINDLNQLLGIKGDPVSFIGLTLYPNLILVITAIWK